MTAKPQTPEEWWSKLATIIAEKMKQGGVELFQVKRNAERNTYEFEVTPVSEPNDAPTESPRPVLDTPERVAAFVRGWIDAEGIGWEAETFLVMMLTCRRHVLAVRRGPTGTLDTILVHPRDVFREAIVCNAHAIVMAHTHPSGDPSPSEADVRVTRELFRAGQLLKIEVVDHVIVGNPALPVTPRGYSSLRELGYFYA